MKKMFLVSLFVASFSSNALASDVPNLHKMFESIKKKAEKGDPTALFELGQAYHFGNYVAVDYPKAVKYLTKASDLGHSDAQNSLGMMYLNGQGVGQNYQLAKKWLTESVHNGNPYAMANLGSVYVNGQGVHKDYRKGCDYYFQSAIKGKFAQSEANVGVCHMNGGFDGKRDYQAARFWLNKAADKGNSFAVKVMKENGWR